MRTERALWHLLRHELRLVSREPRFWLPFLIPPLALVATQIWILSVEGGVAGGVEPRLLFTLGALMAVMGGTLSADSFAGERERNTFELLTSLPVPLESIYWAKVLAIIPIPMLFAIVGQTLFWLLFPGSAFPLLLGAWAFGAAVCLCITGLSVLISLHAGSVRSAGQINAVLVLVALFGTQFVIPALSRDAVWLAAFPLGSVCLFVLLIRLGLRSFSSQVRGRTHPDPTDNPPL